MLFLWAYSKFHLYNLIDRRALGLFNMTEVIYRNTSFSPSANFGLTLAPEEFHCLYAKTLSKGNAAITSMQFNNLLLKLFWNMTLIHDTRV